MNNLPTVTIYTPTNIPDAPQHVVTKLARFTSVGCYPLFYLDSACSVLCADCAQEALEDTDYSDQAPVSCDVNWEDPDLYCDECSERIESAYADD